MGRSRSRSILETIFFLHKYDCCFFSNCVFKPIILFYFFQMSPSYMPTAPKMMRRKLSLPRSQSVQLVGSSPMSLNASLSSIRCGMHGPDISNFQLQQQQMMFNQQQQQLQQQQRGAEFLESRSLSESKPQQAEQIGFCQPQLHGQYQMGMALPMSKRQCMDPSIQQSYKQHTHGILEQQECAYCMYQNLGPSSFHNTVVGSFCSRLTTKLRNNLLRHFIVVDLH